MESQRAHFIHPASNMTMHVKCCLSGHLISTQVVIEADLTLPTTYQNPRLLEGKQVSSINHILHSRKTVSHFYQEIEGTLLKFKIQAISQGPFLKAGLSKDSHLRPAVLAFFFCRSHSI